MKKIIPLLALLVLFACNNAPKKAATTAGTSVDSTSKTMQAAPQGKPLPDKLGPEFYALFKESNTWPIVIDSVFISNASKGDSLGGAQVKLIAKKWAKDDSLQVGLGDALKDFYTIDSLKVKGAYQEWADKLDMGTKYSNAYALNRYKMNDSITLLLWTISYSSIEADPIYSVTDIYYTLMNGDKVGESYLLGEYSTGADPPALGQTLIDGNLNKNGNVLLNEHIIEEDADSSIAEVTHNQYEYAIAGTHINFKNKKRIYHATGVKVKI